MNCQLISFLLAIYIIFMLNFFKTTISFAHPLTYFENKYLYHPIVNTDKPQNMICKIGNYGSWLLGLFLVLRFLFIKKLPIKTISKVVYLIVFIMSLLNLNAVIYLIPYFFIEMYFIIFRCF
jgi:hypothetical protein